MRAHLPALLVATALIASAPACAERYGYAYPDYRDDVQRHAYDRGFHEGVEGGRSDARHGRAPDYRRHDEFRDADEGYKGRYGDREFYRREFRHGYVDGYNAAYQRNEG